MNFEFTCNIIKYDPGEGFKTTAVVIFDFEIDANRLRGIANGLLGSPMLIPFKSIDYIDKNIGKFADFYQGEIFSHATLDFYELNGVVVSFRKGHIRGWVEDDILNKWGARSVYEFFDGNLLKNVILTNYSFGRIHSEKTEAYHISIKS